MQLLVLKNQKTSTAENFKGLMILSVQEVFTLLKLMTSDISDLKSESHRITGQFRLRALLSFEDHQERRCTNHSGPCFRVSLSPQWTFFSCNSLEFTMFWLMSVAFCPITVHLNSLFPSSSHPFILLDPLIDERFFLCSWKIYVLQAEF